MNIDGPESSAKYILEILSYSVCNYQEKKELNINSDFTVTGWMLCVIPYIIKYASDHSDSDNRKHINNVIKILFHGLYDDDLHFTLELS